MACRFESERALAARKEERRRQREALLQQAKVNYEKDEQCREQKRLRGEDTWMLNEVNERLEDLQKEHSVTKKKKHSKKHKRGKKKKKTKTEKKDDSSDNSTDFSEEEWVEASVSQSSSTEQSWKMSKEQSEDRIMENPAAVQRDEWMTLDFMSVKTLSSASLKSEKQKEKILEQQKTQENEQLLLSERELNPYWKDGGTGLPPEEVTSLTKVTAVEDGGLSWLKKSYQRMKEQSEREQRDLEEIIAERYGSVEVFQSKLKEAEMAAVQTEKFGRRGCGKYSYSEHKCLRHREEKEMQEENDTEKLSCKEQPKERHNKAWSEEQRNYKGGEPAEAEESRQSNKAPTITDFTYKTKNLYQIKNYDKPFSNSLKAAFLKPNHDGDEGSKQQRPLSQLLTPSSSSCGFRKHADNTGGIPRWRKAQPKEDIGKTILDEKPSQMDLDASGREKEPREKRKKSPESTVETKDPLESKTPCSGSDSEDENPHILSDEEMNKLGAKILKAELMGNKDLAAKLQAQLDKARKLKDSGAQAKARESEKGAHFQRDHEVPLFRTDKSGRTWPVNISEEPLDHLNKRRKKQMITTHIDKERVRYFQDDDNMDLKDLFRNEKMSTAEDQNKLFMRMASKISEKTDKDYYTLDDMFISKAAKEEEGGEEERQRQRKQAIREHQQLAAWMEKCPHCFGSPELPKHLIIAIGNKVYLSLPKYQSLTEGHCLIIPMQHYTAATLLDEDIWEEIQVFRKTLVKMFEDQELDCVFLETNLSIKKQYHMVYECIPLPKEVGEMAPIYFKKAIIESDEEWAMNKKLIDLASKDVRKSVPKGLPYFCVDFGLQGGFAHVIENHYKFPLYFGKEIVGGMLDLEPRLWRKGWRENFDDQRKKVLRFAQKWKPFDFTKSKE